jgi:hypothetical protein
MSSYGNEISPQYLDKVYEDLSREQLRLLGDLKTDVSSDISKDVAVQKQLSLLNTLVITVLRLRNLKKKLNLNL